MFLYTSLMRFIFACGLLIGVLGFASEKKIKVKDLPPPVRKTVHELAKTSTLVGLSREVEGGKTSYEAETKVNGKSRDVSIAEDGRIISTEDVVSLNSIPAPARAAIEKEAAGGKITVVEKVTTGPDVKYEASIMPKSGNKKEIAFTADGSLVK